MFDSHGVLSDDRDDLSDLQRRYCRGEKGIDLKEALQNADVFLGLSAGNILTPEMLLGMAKIQLFLQWQIQLPKLITTLLLLQGKI